MPAQCLFPAIQLNLNNVYFQQFNWFYFRGNCAKYEVILVIHSFVAVIPPNDLLKHCPRLHAYNRLKNDGSRLAGIGDNDGSKWYSYINYC